MTSSRHPRSEAPSLPPPSSLPSPPASMPFPVPVDTQAPPPVIGPEETHRLSSLYDRLNRTDHYTLLGVSATADVKDIKRAYYALAKQVHPDRFFRKDVGALASKVEAIFRAMTAALDTLTSAEERAAYDDYLREVLKTRISRRSALAFEARAEWEGAADAWGRVALSLPADAFVHHRLGYALLRARSSYPAAIDAASRAIALDPTRAEYRVTAACLYLASGLERSALAELGVACELEPERADLAGLHAALAERCSKPA